MAERLDTVSPYLGSDAAGGSFAVDRCGRIAQWDAGASALLGVAAGAALQRPCHAVVAGTDRNRREICGTDCPAARALQQGRIRSRVAICTAGRNGHGQWLCCELTALPSESGGALGRLYPLNAGGPSLAHDLAGVATLTTALRDCSPPEGARQALDFLLCGTGADAAELFLADLDGSAVALARHAGRDRRAFGQIRRFGRGEGFPGLVLARGEAVWSDRLAWEPRYLRTRVQQRGYQTYLCVPMVTRSGVAGALGLAFRPALPKLEYARWLMDCVAAPLALLLRDERQSHRPASTRARAGTAAGRARRRSESALAADTAPLGIRCFGAFELTVRGQAVPPASVHRKKSLTLLKMLLAAHGRLQPKDVLIEALWPDADPQRHSSQFYVLVHELRRLIEAPGTPSQRSRFIRNQQDLYYFDTDAPCRVDLIEFRQLIERARRAARAGDEAGTLAQYEAAVELYRGDFLEEERFAEWCWLEREQLREQCLDALARLAALLGGQGRWRDSSVYLQRALALDPVREDLHRQLIYALWASGQRSEAVRQYARCREALAGELDVAPMPETRQLLQRVQACAHPAADDSPPLPPRMD